MAIYWPTPGFKGRTFKLCGLIRWDYNFCVRSSPRRGGGGGRRRRERGELQEEEEEEEEFYKRLHCTAPRQIVLPVLSWHLRVPAPSITPLQNPARLDTPGQMTDQFAYMNIEQSQSWQILPWTLSSKKSDVANPIILIFSVTLFFSLSHPVRDISFSFLYLKKKKKNPMHEISGKEIMTRLTPAKDTELTNFLCVDWQRV